MRQGTVTRKTKETDVEVAIDLDGSGRAQIATGIGFLDHMLDLLARHSRIDITVKAKGDLHIDHHHTTEDVGIALGQAVKQALGDMKGITRYADVHVPMDEALTRVALDISGRPFLVFKVGFVRAKRSSMWSRKPIPVAICARPLPSRSIATSTSVSLVLRATVPWRIREFPLFARLLSGLCRRSHRRRPRLQVPRNVHRSRPSRG